MQVLGEFLIELGLVTLEQLEEALEFQSSQREKRVGDILVEKGYLSHEGLERALSMQKVFRGEYEAGESQQQKTDYLRHVHLFNEFTETDLRTLAVVCYQQSFDQGHILFAEGEPGDALYLVTSGAVRLVKSSPRGEEQELAVMGTGDFFGEMALVDEGPRSATAIVQRHGALLVLPKAQLDRLLEEDHEFALKLYKIFTKTLCERLRHANVKMAEMAGHLHSAGGRFL
jgi:CRP-like cAMP-binding protein